MVKTKKKNIATKKGEKKEFSQADKKKFEKFCADGLSHRMIAFKFKTNEARLYERVYRAYKDEEFAIDMKTGNEMIDYFREEYKIFLHEKQFELATNGDRTMLVWLGKNELGQTDKQETTLRSNVDVSLDIGLEDFK